MSLLHVSWRHFSLTASSSLRHIALQQDRAIGARSGVVMAVILGVVKRTNAPSANVFPMQPASLMARVAAALRRGADRRFTEQLAQVERTGRAGAF
jgi:hypothetical protein